MPNNSLADLMAGRRAIDQVLQGKASHAHATRPAAIHPRTASSTQARVRSKWEPALRSKEMPPSPVRRRKQRATPFEPKKGQARCDYYHYYFY